MLVSIGAVLLGAASTLGQTLPSLPSKVGPLTFSPSCQQSIISVLTNGSFASCFKTADLLPILLSNDSIIPYLDKFMTDLCGPSDVCTNATLDAASVTILQGCGSDLMGEGFPNATVPVAFSLYPVVRDVLCLKTSDPYTNASYGGALGEPPIPVTAPVYNQTNGTFCVTSVLTQLSAYFQDNITVPWITGAVTGQNTTAVNLVKAINPNILCNECIFGAVDVIAAAFPPVATTPINNITNYLNISLGLPANATLQTIMDGECAYKQLAVSLNGTLPANITETAQNTTMAGGMMLPNITNGMMGPAMPMSMPAASSMASMSGMPSMASMASMASMSGMPSMASIASMASMSGAPSVPAGPSGSAAASATSSA